RRTPAQPRRQALGPRLPVGGDGGSATGRGQTDHRWFDSAADRRRGLGRGPDHGSGTFPGSLTRASHQTPTLATSAIATAAATPPPKVSRQAYLKALHY